ncbi:MAG TPA: hypothetical protein VJT67_14030, partial [Longimicrobiaceae bacterium]|nr:hypothetical protein [Longimicrobiaceae bacterium]
PQPPASPPGQPARVTMAEFQQLRWIVGDWRGSGSGQAPFYERYRFVDDSTLVVDSFADSTFAAVTESAPFELRGGRLSSGGGRWVASQITPRWVTFIPVRARNVFTWRYDSRNRWIALLSWPATDTQPARTATYTMERVR